MNKSIKDPGLGTFSNKKAKRFIDNKGGFNVKHINKKKSVHEAYAYVIGLSWFYAIGFIVAAFAAINFVFAFIYLWLGGETIGIKSQGIFNVFLKSYFFSVQTLTSLGYGYHAPHNIATGVVSSVEAFLGLIFFAFITGLLYGKFSKPQSTVRFSDKMVLCNYKEGRALMFKVMSVTKNMTVLSKIKTSLLLSEENDDQSFTNRFFELELERSQITYFSTSWTVVHFIDDKSPLLSYSNEEIAKLHGEFLVLLSYYDESFNQEVHVANSYVFDDIELDKKFVRVFDYNEEGQMILDHAKLNKTRNDSSV